jgi:hypothetical protein
LEFLFRRQAGEAIGSRLLFSGQQPGHDFFAVDDGVAIVPSADVMNFDLLSSFTPIESPTAAREALRALSALNGSIATSRHRSLFSKPALKYGTRVSRRSEPFEKNWQTCDPHGTSPRLSKPVAA